MTLVFTTSVCKYVPEMLVYKAAGSGWPKLVLTQGRGQNHEIYACINGGHFTPQRQVDEPLILLSLHYG